MKILHTADWHLGKRLDGMERTEEHIMFLDWLEDTIEKHQIDLLLVSGDIFDTGIPSSSQLKTYYNFLLRISKNHHIRIIITGGNHDSPAALNAPKELLEHFGINIIGGATEDIKDEIIAIKNQDNQIEIIVCAVPFLRDKDLRLSNSGETPDEQKKRIKDGIENHYKRLVPYVEKHKKNNIPIIAMGHLFASGGTTSESEKDIHVGGLGQISAEQFPSVFDYIALGHLHRQQSVGGLKNIRYSGSPIPLSFSEAKDTKKVLIIETQKPGNIKIEEINIPCFRALIRMNGIFEEVCLNLKNFNKKNSSPLPSWIEINVYTDSLISNLEEILYQQISNNKEIEQLFIKQLKKQSKTQALEETKLSLQNIDPKTVFIKKYINQWGVEPEKNIISLFDYAMEFMMQEKNTKEI